MKDFKLDNHPKIPSGFTTPTGYFDNLEPKLMEKINVEKKPVVIRSLNFRRVVVGMAAVFILLFGITFMFKTQNNIPDEEQIENYLSQNLNTYDMMALMEDGDFKNFDIELNLDNEIIENQIYKYNYIDILLNE